MTNQEIENTMKIISDLPEKERFQELHRIAKKIGCFYLSNSGTDSQVLFLNIHTYLQSQMMLNACVSAEESSKFAQQSCRLAKIAAIAACVGAFFAGLPSINHILVWLF